MDVDDSCVADVVISDTTLKEQADVERLPQTDWIDRLISQLQCDSALVQPTCSTLAYRVFIPWLNKQNQANKIYFAKKGGIKLCVKWMMDPDADLVTRISAGTAVWNFAESGPMYEILWKEGAVQALFSFLDSDFQLQRVAIGALFGLLDYDVIFKTPLPVEIVSKILRVRKPANSEDWALTLGKAGCIVCLAKNEVTRKELMRLGAQKELVTDQCDVFLNYLCAIGLAHMVVEESVYLPCEERAQIISKISEQFSHSPKDIRVKEREYGVVWKCFDHFRRLLDAKDPILCKFGLFCLANLSYGDYNRTVLEQDLLGYLVCLQWRYPQFQDYFDIIFSNFETPLFPSLSVICQFHGARIPDDT